MSLNIKKYDVTLELVEDLLGTCPKDRDVYARFVQGKAREQLERDARKNVPLAGGADATEENVAALMTEEVETVKEIEEKGWTSFHTDEDGPFLYDYAVKGFLCEAARTLKEHGEGPRAVKQLQDKFKRYVFVQPRRVRLPPADETPLERPLRAMTAQGPRVTVTRSDVVKAGAHISFRLAVLHGGGITKACLADVMEYGLYLGLGQWRSGGHGRVKVVKLEAADD